MTESSTDRIHKEIVLRAARTRVWRALTDSAEFSEWFGVRLEGPFRVGEKIQGRITHPGYEHLTLEAWVERIGAPAASVAQLRALFDGAPREVRQAFAIGAPGPHDFAVPVALLRGSAPQA